VPSLRPVLIWAALVAALSIPLAIAATSPLLAWREPVYIGAAFAGVVALALLVVQLLLAGGYLPGLPPRHGRRLHRWIGAALVLSVQAHVAGLWLTSPPDVVDALLFASATPFSAWGVVAMWAVFATALLALLRRPLRISPGRWRLAHGLLALVIVSGTVVHAMLIDGTMGRVSKALLCLLAVMLALKLLTDLRIWTLPRRKRG
jgi:predicted ferric reductase